MNIDPVVGGRISYADCVLATVFSEVSVMVVCWVPKVLFTISRSAQGVGLRQSACRGAWHPWPAVPISRPACGIGSSALICAACAGEQIQVSSKALEPSTTCIAARNIAAGTAVVRRLSESRRDVADQPRGPGGPDLFQRLREVIVKLPVGLLEQACSESGSPAQASALPNLYPSQQLQGGLNCSVYLSKPAAASARGRWLNSTAACWRPNCSARWKPTSSKSRWRRAVLPSVVLPTI